MRVEVFYKEPEIDGRVTSVLRTLHSAGIDAVEAAAVGDVYIVDGVPEIDESVLREAFSDPVSQDCQSGSVGMTKLTDWRYLVEVHYRPGVTNPVALTAREALEHVTGARLPENALVQTAQQYLFAVSGAIDGNTIASTLYNPLIESAVIIERGSGSARPPEVYPHHVQESPTDIELFDIGGMNDEQLTQLSTDRLLALTIDEMKAVQRYFADPKVVADRETAGLPSSATDVELEMIAQTWSEHCKHKILNAQVTYTDGVKTQHIDSLFKTYIRKTTEDLEELRPYLRSVFHDNSGVVAFDDDHLVCFKAETHNSPSALDPYGGAITGIVGVNRDILGTGKGARPIFNTNVLCFGYQDTPDSDIPDGLLHPRRVLSGVHRGIVDGGNQSGIPVVAGGFVFDESYLGKPLVFCGTGGILPAEIEGEGAWIDHIDPGDIAVMVGGRIGKDGIHGATFSSLALDEASPTSAVQIGDPITQKKMADFLMEARDLGLYKGITDNGAGGLSSSLGEMSEASNGIRIDLHRCPLKYQGLAPWEILVSESQERMSLSVYPDKLDDLLALAGRRDVEATAIGEFTDTGFIEAYYNDELVLRLSEAFLHDGLPEMNLTATWPNEQRHRIDIPETDLKSLFTRVLSSPNVRSKEDLIRQYDHEVQAGSVVKPFAGVQTDGPTDGAVFRPVYTSKKGLTVTHGVCPRYGDDDTYRMAACAVDEAYRAHISCGGDPEEAAVLDNFCWPDPVQSATTPDGEYKMAQLVRACQGLQDTCMAYTLPLISGKDSMKNDAKIGGRKISVRPTLLISLMGGINDIRGAVTTDFKSPGDAIYLLGTTRGEMGGSIAEYILGGPFGEAPAVCSDEARAGYHAIHACMRQNLVRSCHDLSDGGLGVALAESCIGGRLGAHVDLDAVPAAGVTLSTVELLFCESASRLLFTVASEHCEAVERVFRDAMAANEMDIGIARIGSVTGDDGIVVDRGEQSVVTVNIPEALAAWKGDITSFAPSAQSGGIS